MHNHERYFSIILAKGSRQIELDVAYPLNSQHNNSNDTNSSGAAQNNNYYHECGGDIVVSSRGFGASSSVERDGEGG